jgi:hypothetical protein
MTPAAFLAVAILHLMAARIGVTEGPRAGGVIRAAAAPFGLALVFQAAPALLWALKKAAT